MRKEFAKQIKHYLQSRSDTVVLLGDISVGLFINDDGSLPDRVLNVGILEQSMLSYAAGLARGGLLPFVHTISPFMVERAYEQIKLDLGYNRTKCILVSANGPYDYKKLGPTHHCPSDVPLITLIPSVKIALPGRESDLADVLKWAIEQPFSSYIRLTENCTPNNKLSPGVTLKSKGSNGNKKIVIFVGESLGEYAQRETQYTNFDVLYAWQDGQVPDNLHLEYNEIEIWEPYSVPLIAHRVCEQSHYLKSLLSHVYCCSMEDGVFNNPEYVSRRFK